MPVLTRFDVTPATVDNNPRLFVEGAVLRRNGDGDIFGTVIDPVYWSKLEGNAISVGLPVSNGAVVAEGLVGADYRWTWNDAARPNAYGYRRNITVRDYDIVGYYPVTSAALGAASSSAFFLRLWKQLSNNVQLAYNSRHPGNLLTVQAYKIINGAATLLGTTVSLGVQADMWLRIKRIAATNTFSFYYATSDPAVGGWNLLWSGVVSDAVHFPVNCDLYPLFDRYNNNAGFAPQQEYYRQTREDIPFQRFWPTDDYAWVTGEAGVEWALDAGPNSHWVLSGVSAVLTEPGTSTVKFRIALSDTGSWADAEYCHATPEDISVIDAMAAAGEFNKKRYIHVEAHFSNAEDEQPTLSSMTWNGLVYPDVFVTGGINTGYGRNRR